MLSAAVRRRARAARATGDLGATLVELSVVLVIASTTGAMALSFLIGSMHASSNASDTSTITANGRTALAAIAADVRLADTPTPNPGYSTARFTTILSSQVVFYSNLNPDRSGSNSRTAPTKVSFTASGTSLVEALYSPLSPYASDYTTNYPSAPTTSKVLLTDLASTNVFAYYNGTVNPTTGAPNLATTGTSVAAVGITLVLTAPPGEPSQTFTSTVSITGALS